MIGKRGKCGVHRFCTGTIVEHECSNIDSLRGVKMMTGFYCPLNTPPYINIREQKTLQTLHKILHSLRISLIFRTLYCVGFEAKILHKPCMEPYMGTKRLRDKETKRRGLPQPLPKGKGFVAALMHRTWGSFFGDQRDEERESGRGEG